MRVELHDGQHLYAVVKRRRCEADTTWWYDLQIHLPAATHRYGRLSDEPAPVVQQVHRWLRPGADRPGRAQALTGNGRWAARTPTSVGAQP
ncbi:hypothetical protein [Streptomyces sp. HPF1205]|uniref:hypothetical protein n=1 Tax=Streptomyces sp. HPF1205 TaxID=2873262 RepID=UPI001CEC92CF|nr:hypothetical protein [Streptomyces sp. HPF1205]